MSSGFPSIDAIGQIDGLVGADEITIEATEEQQKLDDWFAKRSGMLTCSRFGDLLGKGLVPAKTIPVAGYTYLREVIAERIGSFKFSGSARSTEWGHDNESKAVEAYQERTGRDVDYDSHRFVKLTKWVGGSPDGLVGDDRALEIKCPYNPGVHVETLMTGEVPLNYRWQCVGHCLVTGRSICDFVSFDPRIEGRNSIVVVEFEPTEQVLYQLTDRLKEAVEYIKTTIQKIEERNQNA